MNRAESTKWVNAPQIKPVKISPKCWKVKKKIKKKKKKKKKKKQIQIKEIKNKTITPINTKTSGTRPKDQRKTVK